MLSGCCLPGRFSVPSSESHNVRPLPHRLSALQCLPYGSQKLSLWQHSVPGYMVPVLRQVIQVIRKPPALPGYKSHISSLPETPRESIFRQPLPPPFAVLRSAAPWGLYQWKNHSVKALRSLLPSCAGESLPAVFLLPDSLPWQSTLHPRTSPAAFYLLFHKSYPVCPGSHTTGISLPQLPLLPPAQKHPP